MRSIRSFKAVAGLVLAWLAFVVVRVVREHFDRRTVVASLLLLALAIVTVAYVAVRARRRGTGFLAATEPGVESDIDRQMFLVRVGLAGLVLLALAAAAILFAIGTKSTLRLQVGDCFSPDQQPSVAEVATVPCALPHGLEIFAIASDPAPAGAAFPGLEAIRAAARSTCERAYPAYVGEPYGRFSRFAINVLSPEQPYWDIGMHFSYCALMDPGGRQTSGSGRAGG